jgi:AcrR family transcriptional regulator
VPRLWDQTIEAHRREVRDAILDTTAALVAEHGLRSVTMSQIAEETGIGRATLYKYFSGVEPILFAWHERQITGHLEYLAEVRDQGGNAREQLEAVLEAYALIRHESHGHDDNELAAFLHGDEQKQVARAQAQLRAMIRDLLASTLWQRPAACRRRRRSADSSRSRWPACAPAPDPHVTARLSACGIGARRRGPCRAGSSPC